MRIDKRDVKRFSVAAAGLYVGVGVVALVAPASGWPLAIAVTGLLSGVVLITLFWRAWHWFISEAFGLIEERARGQYEGRPKDDG
jgi:hypothetical protein